MRKYLLITIVTLSLSTALKGGGGGMSSFSATSAITDKVELSNSTGTLITKNHRINTTDLIISKPEDGIIFWSYAYCNTGNTRGSFTDVRIISTCVSNEPETDSLTLDGESITSSVSKKPSYKYYPDKYYSDKFIQTLKKL